MTGTDLKQRLVAILAADAAGYSRLMSLDERSTVAALDASRSVFRARTVANQGRIVDTAGDSVLAVFETAAGALNAALEIQAILVDAGPDVPPARRMLFRIGIHSGDVMEKTDGSVYGDGVNIAARLQALAEPGQITVSDAIHGAVLGKVSATFTDQGEQTVKNIARPVHVYRVSLNPIATAAQYRGLIWAWRRWPRTAAGATILVIAFGAGLLAPAKWFEKTSQAALSLLGAGVPGEDSRPSVAVMPLANQSGDAQRDYFSDGMTEDIINALGRFSGIRVVSNNAVRAYKGRPTDHALLSRELGVRYVARGSVRQADGRLRVSVELSDASNGTQLWSDRFEGTGQQVFDLQDQVVRNIVAALAVKLSSAEQKRVVGKPTDNLEAYDLVLHARSLLNRSERSSNREARRLLAQALSLAPNYAAAHVSLADADYQQAILGWVENLDDAIDRSEAAALHALALDDPDSSLRAHGLLGSIHILRGNYDQALNAVNQAIKLNGSDTSAFASRGAVLLWMGRIDEAIADIEAALRFDPQLRPAVHYDLALAYYLAGRFQDTVALTDRITVRNPEFGNALFPRAMALAELGDAQGTALAVEQIRKRFPFFKVELFGTRFANPADRDKSQASLRKAGL